MDHPEDQDQTTTPRRGGERKRAQSPIDHKEVHSNSRRRSTSFSTTAPTLPSSLEPHWKYDVFPSFRGEDVRKGFLSHLCYALERTGIYIFIDNSLITRGEEVSSELHDAIQGSRISIVVFSKGYASSRWCLDELVKILHCKKTKGCIVLPIFYHVDPSDVRNQTGTFAEAFARHEERFGRDMELVQRWRKALVEAGNISGWDTKDENGYESMLIQKVVANVSMHLDVAVPPTPRREGYDSVEEIKTLLNLGTSNVRIVGIYGMAGIGKTNLATAVYNQIRGEFEGSSFLSNIREISKEPNGLVQLQEQLLSDILEMKDVKIDNVDKGVILIKQKLQWKRVLVVLDDVDHLIRVDVLAASSEWFGPGSRVIATTRDGYLLNQMQVNAKYKVEAWTHDSVSRPHLVRNASNNIPPPIDREYYHELMIGGTLEEVANHAGWDLESVAIRHESNFKTDDQSLVSFSESKPNHWDHDVFLSFRGEDIGKTFLGHLKSALDDAGIRVFLDREKLKKGENISDGLRKAIKGSRISIVVFSKRYASSNWCLNELVEILNCTKTNGHSLIPVFLYVEPTHVRHQTGDFGQEFNFLVKNPLSPVNEETERRWRETLIEAATCSGWNLESDANWYEADLKTMVVEDISSKVNVVGLDAYTRKVKDLLKLGTTEVRTVGIYGMAGMGKTTLARLTFDQIYDRFEGGCFLLDIEEISEKPDGLVRLQKRLLRDILKMENLKIDSIHEGIDLIKKSLQGKKVLIVLDNVNHMKQLHALAGNSEWLGPGSRILATTRDERLLTRLGVHGKLKAEELNYWECFQLFNQYAFGMVEAREGYLELSIRAVELVGGVPLALKAWGSFLQGRSTDVWKRVLDFLEKKSS